MRTTTFQTNVLPPISRRNTDNSGFTLKRETSGPFETSVDALRHVSQDSYLHSRNLQSEMNFSVNVQRLYTNNKKSMFIPGPTEKRNPKPRTTPVRILDASKISFHRLYILTLITGIIDGAIFYLRPDTLKVRNTKTTHVFLHLVLSCRLLKCII